ncbi:lipase family protein [Nocardia sp. NPDC058058]|uniref:lipase family protein n=1 Tax=Nocardia sp. NPDC058058 TaxID=3346317 RepID=UPI0036D8A720
MQLFDVASRCAVAAVVAMAGVAVSAQVVDAPMASAAPASADPFYSYDGPDPLAEVSPGAVLKTRTVDFHVAGIPLPIKVTQLLYRTTSALGAPAVTAASVMKPIVPTAQTRLVSYQSAYDSLSSSCQPSYNVAGGFDEPLGSAFTAEAAGVIALLTAGYTVVVSDFEGQRPDFGVGPQAGMGVLDGIRAAMNSPEVGLPADVPIGMIGYSGGGIGTEWASELAPEYAPDVNSHLVGAASGGLPANPIRNISYAEGSLFWSTVLPMALVGISRAYEVDMTPYLTDYGQRITNTVQNGCLDRAALNGGPLLQWGQMVKPEYPRPESIPALVRVANKLIMSTGGTPTIPLYIAQGTIGELEGTLTKPELGAGDGIMLAGDTAGLAQEYCNRGVTVQYEQYPGSHGIAGSVWELKTIGWLADRFNGVPAPQNCGALPPGDLPRPLPES